jgi:hypothetical protein
MVVAIPLAGWLLLVSLLAVSGAFENLEQADIAIFRRLGALSALAVAGAITCAAGLAMRRRLVAAVAAPIVLACAAAVLLDWVIEGWRLERDDTYFVAALTGVILAALVSVWAALRPKSHER